MLLRAPRRRRTTVPSYASRNGGAWSRRRVATMRAICGVMSGRSTATSPDSGSMKRSTSDGRGVRRGRARAPRRARTRAASRGDSRAARSDRARVRDERAPARGLLGEEIAHARGKRMLERARQDAVHARTSRTRARARQMPTHARLAAGAQPRRTPELRAQNVPDTPAQPSPRFGVSATRRPQARRGAVTRALAAAGGDAATPAERSGADRRPRPPRGRDHERDVGDRRRSCSPESDCQPCTACRRAQGFESVLTPVDGRRRAPRRRRHRARPIRACAASSPGSTVARRDLSLRGLRSGAGSTAARQPRSRRPPCPARHVLDLVALRDIDERRRGFLPFALERDLRSPPRPRRRRRAPPPGPCDPRQDVGERHLLRVVDDDASASCFSSSASRCVREVTAVGAFSSVAFTSASRNSSHAYQVAPCSLWQNARFMSVPS